MSEVLGYIKNVDGEGVRPYYDKDDNGFQIITLVSVDGFKEKVPSEKWVSNLFWVEVDKPDPLTEHTYKQVGNKIGELVDRKNRQYGDSFNKSGEYLSLLYPNGIQPDQYKDALALVRDFDKSMRIANGNQGDENAWNDKAGYSILMSGE